MSGAGARSATASYSSGGGGAATALAYEQDTAPLSTTVPSLTTSLNLAAPATAQGEQQQASLFRDLPGGAKIVPIPTLSPLRPASPLDRESVRRNAARSAARSPRQSGHMQQPLDLRERQGKIQARPDEALFVDARVALPKLRAAAAGIDAFLIACGAGFFLAGCYLAGVEFQVLDSWLLLPTAVTALVALLYRSFWCLLDCDTLGMRVAGLRLVDFDGRAPRRERRIVRQFAGLLSLFSAGVGLVWALVDEESLTWHDHISKTFPTAA